MLSMEERLKKCCATLNDVGYETEKSDWDGAYKIAVQCYRTAAEVGDSLGMNNLAWMYQNGYGVEKDVDKAIDWYLMSAYLGNDQAMINLGNLYEFSEGVKQNDSKAFLWYQQAAELGNPTGLFNYANMLHHGRGTSQNKEKAYEIFSFLYKENIPNTAFYMGLYHQEGWCIKQDYKKALKYYCEGIEIDNCMYCYNQIGVIYGKGLGVKKDIPKALYYYSEAAKRGDALSFTNIAYLYEIGDGVKRDRDKAILFYQLAANLGEENAIRELERIKREEGRRNE